MIFNDLEKYGNSIALIDEVGKTFTFRELIKQADKMSNHLEPRQLIFILCNNDLSAISGYIGVLRRHVVPLLIRADIQEDILHNLFDLYQPNYIWADRNRKFSFFMSIYTDDHFVLWKTNYSNPPPMNTELALLLSTSGSTGNPKLVRQSYRNLESNTNSIIKYLNLTSNDRAITSMPMYYTYGLSIIQTQLSCGGSIVVTNYTMFQPQFWDLIKSNNVTNFGGVPYSYEILKKIHFEKMDLPSLRFITQAGGKLASALSAEFVEICSKKGIEFIIMYGACEATARMSFLPGSMATKKIESIGIAIPGGRFTILNDGKETTSPNIEGELIYYGENVTLGYAECREDLIRGDDNQGRLSTGDIAKCDEDGYFYIVGRKKRFLKIFGNRISLDSVETFLKDQGYTSFACSGVDDKLKVYISESVDIRKMKELLSKFTHLHGSAFSIISVEKIPRNTSGKIQYSKLEDYVK